MKFGARILKTGLSITLGIYVAMLLQLPVPSFAGFAAITAIQPTVYRSFKTLRNQVQANVIGASLAIIFTLVFGSNPIIVGFTCILMLSIALKLKMQDYVTVSLVTIVAIMEFTGDDFLYYAVLRFGTTFVGLISASLINTLFYPPNHEVRLANELEEQTKQISRWIRISMHQAAEHATLKDEIQIHREKMVKLQYYYLLYNEEYKGQIKKKGYVEARKLVLYRKIVSATEEVFQILKLISKLEPHLHMMPEEIQTGIKENLENLLTFHEQALLKFEGKVKLSSNEHFATELQNSYDELLQNFSILIKGDNSIEFVHVIQLFSAITTYKEKLEAFDGLLISYQKFHQDEEDKSSFFSKWFSN